MNPDFERFVNPPIKEVILKITVDLPTEFTQTFSILCSILSNISLMLCTKKRRTPHPSPLPGRGEGIGN